MINLILFGPPGSGKGTQAEKLIEKYNLVHISTGDLLRSEKKVGTPLGLEAKKFMDNGMLVPDEVVIGMIGSKLDECMETANGFIFDGFPRTVAQAEALDKLLTFKQTTISQFIALKVSDEELISRLLERGKTSGRADDASEEVIQKRIRVYKEETMPVAEHYGAQEKFHSIKGEGTIEEIFGRLCIVIDETVEA